MSLIGTVVQGLCVKGTPLPPDSLETWAVYTALWFEVRNMLELEISTHINDVLLEAFDLEEEEEPAWLKVGNYVVLEACSLVRWGVACFADAALHRTTATVYCL
jgi:hypothetical protein